MALHSTENRFVHGAHVAGSRSTAAGRFHRTHCGGDVSLHPHLSQRRESNLRADPTLQTAGSVVHGQLDEPSVLIRFIVGLYFWMQVWLLFALVLVFLPFVFSALLVWQRFVHTANQEGDPSTERETFAHYLRLNYEHTLRLIVEQGAIESPSAFCFGWNWIRHRWQVVRCEVPASPTARGS